MLSDDSLTMSPEQPVVRTPGTLKRANPARLHPSKRLAVSVPCQVRKTSPLLAPDPAHDHGPKSTEERILALELQRAAELTDMAKLHDKMRQLEQQLSEHTKMGVDLRCDVFSRFGTVSDQMGVIENEFSTVEAQIESHTLGIDTQIAFLQPNHEAAEHHLEKTEVQRSVDARGSRRIWRP